ncbi:MAG: MscL family protein [Clostridia bacterium]|nr:MscL family protein [Clostridia bacterium]
MKKFFSEYRTFIKRGNVVDMAVGIIVGAAFTAIVTSLSNSILTPLVNYILAVIIGKDYLSGIRTFLIKTEVVSDVLDAEGNVIGTEIVTDLAQSIYIDWDAFINAVIHFFLIALVLFTIVKIINKMRSENLEFQEKVKKARLTREQRAELKANGIKRRDKAAVVAFFSEKQRLAAQAAARAAAEAAEAERLYREANPTTEELLKMILAEIKK